MDAVRRHLDLSDGRGHLGRQLQWLAAGTR